MFNLAGVNRPQNQEEFMQGNFGFASTLLDTLKKHGNRCPVMLSSSQQASLTGRFGNSEYLDMIQLFTILLVRVFYAVVDILLGLLGLCRIHTAINAHVHDDTRATTRHH